MPYPHQPRTTEREITLIFVSDRPERIRDEIVALAVADEFSLVPAGTIEFEDVYFDTPARELRTHRWALRIRSGMGRHLFALKGPSRRTEWDGVERIEIEAVWSDQSARLIADELSSRGITVHVSPEPDPGLSPHEAMRHAGFQVVQARRTRRDLKRVLPASGDETLAELAIDRVRFAFHGTELWHWELEIEAENPAHTDRARALAEFFLAKFGSELRRWNHGKLATGFALEKLLQAGTLEGLVLPNHTLTAAVYDRLAEDL